MILWIALFILVLAISFILAVQSMRDYREISFLDDSYSLFLVRKIKALDRSVLSSLYDECLRLDLSLSFERLIKGKKSALVIFGPKRVIGKFISYFDLLELEDYTNVDPDLIGVSAWEVEVRKGELFRIMPHLSDTEQFWWQLILKPARPAGGPAQPKSFQVNIRAVVVSQDPSKRKSIADIFQKVKSDVQVIDFYKKRSFIKDENTPARPAGGPALNLDEILQLLKI